MPDKNRFFNNPAEPLGGTFSNIPVDVLIPFPGNRDIVNTDTDILGDTIYTQGFSSTVTVARERNDDGTVMPDSMRYLLVDGHRRVAALRYIYDKYDSSFMNRCVPAFILNDSLSMDDLRILNRSMNSLARSESPLEQMKHIAELKELFHRKGQDSDLAQRIGDSLSLNRRTVYRYININEHLIPELKELMGKNFLGMALADKIASYLNEEYQMKLFLLTKDGDRVSEDDFMKLHQKQDREIIEAKEENRRLSSENDSLKQSIEREKEYRKAKHREDMRFFREKKRIEAEKDYEIARERERADKNEKKARITQKALESDYLSHRKAVDDAKILDKIKVSKHLSDIESDVSTFEEEILSFGYIPQVGDIKRLDSLIARLNDVKTVWNKQNGV